MDVCGIFAGDTTLSYGGSLRNPYYRDFEQFPYGTLESTNQPICKDSYSKVQEKCQQTKSHKTSKKECPFCKEHKKRPLINYLRKREMRKHHESICEEEEECSNAPQNSEEEEEGPLAAATNNA